jgi:uncharacterized membrane protein
MARIEESVEIRCPLDMAFAYTTDAKSWPDWQTIIRRAEQTSAGPWGVGTTTKGIVHMMGLSMKWTARVTENDPNQKWAKNITSPGMSIAEQVTVGPAGDGMKFTIAYDIKTGGIMKLFSPMIASSMRKETVRSLANLKNILESRA